MKIPASIGRKGRLAAMAVAATLALTACDNAIYDDEGDCDVTYRLRFRYDLNMKFADAFAHEVKSVRLYAFDAAGQLVWQYADQGEALAADGYSVVLPLEAGRYRLQAWCGLDGEESFTVPALSAGKPMSALRCALNRQHAADGAAYVDKDLHPLFHGTLDVDLPSGEWDGGDYTYVMPLTKDTNVWRIVLQHLSGEDVEPDDFTFRITDDNGRMDYDNSLLPDERLTYHAWSVYAGEAGVDVGGRAVTTVRAAVAELTTARLVQRDWTTNERPMLTIRRAADGDLVARIPIIDYALLVKGNYNREMSDQEYLDRQDEYSMVLFLDENGRWLNTVIYINSWRVVLNGPDIDS